MKFDHNNISPLDSRYANKISSFRENFSESALIKIRFEIEIEWILFLCNKLPKTFKPLSKNSIEKIINFKNKFDNKSVLKIKKIDATTNHDVKAVEYFIRDYFKKDKVLSSYIHLIHFGLTSEDVNSLSYAVMIKKGISIYVNEITSLNKVLNSYSKKFNTNRASPRGQNPISYRFLLTGESGLRSERCQSRKSRPSRPSRPWKSLATRFSPAG